MKIGIAQIDCVVGDYKANCEKIVSFVEQAKDKECDLVVFPEMSDIAYVPDRFPEFAQPWPGPAFDTIQAAARNSSINVVAGLSEQEGTKIFNSMAVFSNEGKLVAKYRKLHLFSPGGEGIHCEQGEDSVVVEIGPARLGLSICYDLRFPELYRNYFDSEVNVLINIAAWPLARAYHWDVLTTARAIENQSFFIGANRVGKDGALEFAGRSRVLDSNGEILVQSMDESETLLVAQLDFSSVENTRSSLPVKLDKRL